MGLALAIVLGIAACVVAAGCGSVDVVHQVDAGVDVEQLDAGAADSMLSGELAPDRAAADAAADVEQLDAAAEVGPSCSWDCRAFCDCGALPCCRATGAADCCTR